MQDAEHVSSIEGAWWNFEQRAETKLGAPGGCIFMRCALGDLSQASQDDWHAATKAAIWNLSAAHAIGVHHCDIRASNVLNFGDGWQLADWGLASVNGSTVRIGRDTSQGRRMGCRVRQLLEMSEQDELSVDWQPADDWEMLALMPISCPRGPKCYANFLPSRTELGTQPPR